MAVRTKQPQLINAQLKISDIVYFEIDQNNWGATKVNTENGEIDVYRFILNEYSLDEEGGVKPIMSIPILYRRVGLTIPALGGANIIDVLTNADDNIILEIDRVNQIPFSPNRIQNIRYWDLTASGLEKVV
jgi:hypothetical protein